jgi:hypothetical protein
MSLKGALYRKLKEWQEKRRAEGEEKRELRQIYETKKREVRIPAQKRVAEELAEKHAEVEAKQKVEKMFAPRFSIPQGVVSGFRTFQSYARKMPIARNPLEIPDIKMPRIIVPGAAPKMRTKRAFVRKRRVDFSKYL